MSRLTPEDRQRFVDSATAFLVQQERMELLAEQAAGRPGHQLTPSEFETFMAPGRELLRVVDELTAKYTVPAFCFRGRIIRLNEEHGQLSLLIISESDIEVVDG